MVKSGNLKIQNQSKNNEIEYFYINCKIYANITRSYLELINV